MNLKLTEAQAQSIIDDQARQIAALKKRLTQGHVTMKYLCEHRLRKLTRADIVRVTDHLKGIIETDHGDPDDIEFIPQYDHEVIEEKIALYEAIFNSPEWHKHGDYINVPLLGYLYQYAHNGYNDIDARNVEYHVNKLQNRILWREGEPPTPHHFSSPGLSQD